MLPVSPLPSETQPLTRRQAEVCRLLVEQTGQAKTLGVLLGMTPKTFAQHQAAVYQKLGVHNRFELTNRFRGVPTVDVVSMDLSQVWRSLDAKISRVETAVRELLERSREKETDALQN